MHCIKYVGTALLGAGLALIPTSGHAALPWSPISVQDQAAWLHEDASAALHLVSGQGPPLVLVHGYGAGQGDLDAIYRRFAGTFTIYYLAYDSVHRRTSSNGDDFARELRALRNHLPAETRIDIVAHSMGGLVARRALNHLAAEGAAGPIRLFAADTPWHGYAGPGDRGPRPNLFVRLGFLPAGLMDMRAGAWMFRAPGAGVTTAPLAPDLEVHLAFSRDGRTADDYRRGSLRSLAWQITRWIHGQANEPTGSFKLQNFWAALKSSADFRGFRAHLEALRRQGQLDDPAALAALAHYFPEYPGDHAGMLREHPGEFSYLDALAVDLPQK